MQILKRGAAAVAAGALLFSFVTPVFADEDVTISDNGNSSVNTVVILESQTQTVVQGNLALVGNLVVAGANAGNNTANQNTGGDVDITSGKAIVDVSVDNLINKNVASVPSCCCDPCSENTNTVQILDNGNKSTNTVVIGESCSETVAQLNAALVFNGVLAGANSGNNEANKNTDGNVTITTGKAKVKTAITNKVNKNRLNR